MAIWTDDFSGSTAGLEPSGWDTHPQQGFLAPYGMSLKCEEGTYFIGGKYARISTSWNNDYTRWTTPGNIQNAEALLLVKFEGRPASEAGFVLKAHLRASGEIGEGSGMTYYEMGITPTQAKIIKSENGVLSDVSSWLPHSSVGAGFVDSAHWVRFRVEGSALKGKMWRTSATEPVGWDIETSDGSISGAGQFWLQSRAYEDEGESLVVDYAAVGSDGDSPGLPNLVQGDLRISQGYLEVALGPVIGGEVLDASNVVAEWLFSEGSGSVVADVSGNGNHLTLTSPDLWVKDADGTSVRFSPKTHTDRAYLTDLSNNGTIGASLNNASAWTFVVVTKDLDSDNDKFLAGVELTSGGATDFQFRQFDGAENKLGSVAMSRQAQESKLLVTGTEFESGFTVHVQAIDTTRGTDPERHKYYKNGTLVTELEQAPATVINSELTMVDPSTLTIAFGSSPDGTSSSQATIHYALLLNRQVTDDEARDLWTRTRANSDGSVFAESNPPEVAVPPAEVATTDTTITVGTTATSTDPIVHTFGLWAPDARPEVGNDNRLTSVLTGSGALFFVNSVPGTSGVEGTYQFTGLDPDTTYVAYAATTNTVTGESTRYPTATWVTTTPDTGDVVVIDLPVEDSFSEAITNPVLTATGETTADLVFDVDPAFAGGDIYFLVNPEPDAIPYTLEDRAIFEAQAPVVAVSGTNSIPLTGLNAGSEYTVGVLVTAPGAVSNVANLTVVTDSPPATAPVETTPLEEVVVGSGSTGTINLGSSFVTGSEPIVVSYAGLPANYTYTSDGTITLGDAIPGEYLVTRTVSNGTLPNLVTEFSLSVFQSFQVVEGSAGTGLTAPPYVVAVDADIMVYLAGIPNRVVTWQLTGSAGTLTVFNQATDEFGRAAALFSPAPGEEGQVATVSVEYGD